jgi:hypothetical protein
MQKYLFDFHFSARHNLYLSSNFFPKDEGDNYNSSSNTNNSNNNILNITESSTISDLRSNPVSICS